jgi:hypothetical protein
MSPENSAKIQAWRQASREGTLSQDQLREAITLIREGRVGASTTSSKARTASATSRAKKAPVNSDSLLDELDGL